MPSTKEMGLTHLMVLNMVAQAVYQNALIDGTLSDKLAEAEDLPEDPEEMAHILELLLVWAWTKKVPMAENLVAKYATPALKKVKILEWDDE